VLRPELSIAQILAWADFYHERTGRWPRQTGTRFVYNAVGEKWSNIDAALRRGFRGLPGRCSLAQLLAKRRGVRNSNRLPPYREGTILAWADAFSRRHKGWPRIKSGAIPEAPGETWSAVDQALSLGLRGLPGKSSLAQLLAERRGVRNIARLPPLTPQLILAWADAHHRRYKTWPKQSSGPIDGAPGETWSAVHSALHYGIRGLPKGSTLARLLERHRTVRNHGHLPRLTYKKILAWAGAFHRRTGRWPTTKSGLIDGSRGESWSAVNWHLTGGSRGLPGGTSLARLLEKYHGVPNHKNRPRLTHQQVLHWSDAHRRRTGRWPTNRSGPVLGVPGLTWSGLQNALNLGRRGLPGGYSLAQLLCNRRGVRNIGRLPKLSAQQILAWAHCFHQITGRWPGARSGLVPGIKGETWLKVDNALRLGLRSLPGGSTLHRFLKKHLRIRVASFTRSRPKSTLRKTR
jgi:hypothetical protein